MALVPTVLGAVRYRRASGENVRFSETGISRIPLLMDCWSGYSLADIAGSVILRPLQQDRSKTRTHGVSIKLYGAVQQHLWPADEPGISYNPLIFNITNIIVLALCYRNGAAWTPRIAKLRNEHSLRHRRLLGTS